MMNLPFNMMDFVFKMLNLPLNMMDFVLTLVNFPFNMMDFVFKLMNLIQTARITMHPPCCDWDDSHWYFYQNDDVFC